MCHVSGTMSIAILAKFYSILTPRTPPVAYLDAELEMDTLLTLVDK